MIKGIARVSSTLVGTPWAISEVQFANVFNLIDKGFLQLMVNGRMPSMVSGRSISRAPGTNAETTELETGKETLANLTLIAEATPATLKQKIYQAVATWVAQVGERYNFYDKPRDYATLNGLKTALHQATAQKDDVSSLNIYGAMDRVMQKHRRTRLASQCTPIELPILNTAIPKIAMLGIRLTGWFICITMI